jgi:hypothetical protein
MINSPGNAGKRYPQSRDHFKKAVANHVHTLVAWSHHAKGHVSDPQGPSTEPPKQLLTIACSALEAIICALEYTTPVSVSRYYATLSSQDSYFILLLPHKKEEYE